MKTWRPLLVSASVAVASLTAACGQTTPTNTHSGGPGSSYQGHPDAASYETPINGDGPQSS